MKGKIFNAQEVQSILNGSKTMFREVIKPRIKVENYKLDDGSGIGMEILLEECPYQVGQKIFVKESFDGYADSKLLNKYNILYRADGKLSKGSSWKPAQQMKQEHSRITLEIIYVEPESEHIFEPKEYDSGIYNNELWTFIAGQWVLSNDYEHRTEDYDFITNIVERDEKHFFNPKEEN